MERREFMKQAGLGALGVMLAGKAVGEEAKIRWGLVGMGKQPEIIRADVASKDTGGHIGTFEMHESFLDCMKTPPEAGSSLIRPRARNQSESVWQRRWR